jgi:hypothetical protein
VLAVGGPGYGWLRAVMAARAGGLKVVKADRIPGWAGVPILGHGWIVSLRSGTGGERAHFLVRARLEGVHISVG